MRPLAILLIMFCAFRIFLPGLHAETGQPELDSLITLMNDGRFEEARKMLEQFRRKHPGNPRALFYLAQLEENFNKALALLKEVEILAVRPGSPAPDSSLAAEALFTMAEMTFSSGKHSTAVELYERLLSTYPTSDFYPDALYRLGVITLASGETQEALKKFTKCLEIDNSGTKRTLAAVGIMECYVKLEDWKEVLTAAHKVLEEKDEESAVTPRVLEVIARAWRELGNEDNASRFTERLLKNYPDSFQAHAIREKGSRIATNLGFSFNGQSASADSGRIEPTISYSKDDESSIVPEKDASEELSDKDTPVFSVQAAAFEVRTNAYKMYKNLKDKGFDVRIEMKTGGGKHFYKVLIGKYRTREEADSMVDRVTKTTGDKAFVVVVE